MKLCQWWWWGGEWDTNAKRFIEFFRFCVDRSKYVSIYIVGSQHSRTRTTAHWIIIFGSRIDQAFYVFNIIFLFSWNEISSSSYFVFSFHTFAIHSSVHQPSIHFIYLWAYLFSHQYSPKQPSPSIYPLWGTKR